MVASAEEYATLESNGESAKEALQAQLFTSFAL